MDEDYAKGKLEKSISKKFKPRISIGVDVDSYGGPSPVGGDSKWRKEECARIDSEIAAIEGELKDFDHAKAGKKIQQALEIKLKLKKLRREEHRLKIGGSGLGGSY